MPRENSKIPAVSHGGDFFLHRVEGLSSPSHTTVRAIKRLLADTRRTFCGATYLLDAIAEKTGLSADLKRCFPKEYRQLLSLAYYLRLEDSSALSRFSRWAAIHEHPYGQDISSQRSSEILQSVTENAKMEFFRCLARRRHHEEYWAYDSTSISSYSEQLKQVKYGHNKEHGSSMRNLDNYDTQHEVFCLTEKIDWFATKRSKKDDGEVQVTPRRMYMHLYFNHARAAEDELRFMKRMAALRSELESDARVEAHEKAYSKYFKVSKVKGGRKVEIKHDVMQEAQERFGFFALMSNEIKDAREALQLYRNGDVVEKAFIDEAIKD